MKWKASSVKLSEIINSVYKFLFLRDTRSTWTPFNTKHRSSPCPDRQPHAQALALLTGQCPYPQHIAASPLGPFPPAAPAAAPRFSSSRPHISARPSTPSPHCAGSGGASSSSGSARNAGRGTGPLTEGPGRSLTEQGRSARPGPAANSSNGRPRPRSRHRDPSGLEETPGPPRIPGPISPSRLPPWLLGFSSATGPAVRHQLEPPSPLNASRVIYVTSGAALNGLTEGIGEGGRRLVLRRAVAMTGAAGRCLPFSPRSPGLRRRRAKSRGRERGSAPFGAGLEPGTFRLPARRFAPELREPAKRGFGAAQWWGRGSRAASLPAAAGVPGSIPAGAQTPVIHGVCGFLEITSISNNCSGRKN